MKFTAKVRGELSLQELVDYISRECFVPPGGKGHVRLWVGDDPHDISVNLGNPLQFEIVTIREG